jgi:putative transposase
MRVSTASVTKKADGYYITLSLDDQTVPSIKPDFKDDNIVGIDVGLIDFFVTSDNDRVPAPKFLRKAERKLKSAQRRVSRRKTGSNHKKVADTRGQANGSSSYNNRRYEFHRSSYGGTGIHFR